MRQKTHQNIFLYVTVFLLIIFSKPANAGMEFRDDFVWMYSSQKFVEEFKGRSSEDIDTNLHGAEAVAARLAPLARERCHKDGAVENCVESWQWTMDLYIDVKQDIGIEGDAPRQFIPWQNSLYFLGKKIPELGRHLQERFALKGGKLYLVEENGGRRQLELNIFSYMRPARDGIALVECKIAGDEVLSYPNLDREVVFANKGGKVVHRIRIPAAYWKKLAAYHAKEFPKVTAVNWRGGEEQDPYLWAYTEEFAKQYGLPAANIDADMEGALAIAFRGEFGKRWCSCGQTCCGPPSPDFHHEFYFPVGIPLIFVSDKVKGMEYLQQQNSSKNWLYCPDFGLPIDQQSYSRLISSRSLDSRHGMSVGFYYDEKKDKIYNVPDNIYEGTYMPEGSLQQRFVFVDYSSRTCVFPIHPAIRRFCQGGIYVFPTTSGKEKNRSQFFAQNSYVRISSRFTEKIIEYSENFYHKSNDLFSQYYCRNGYDSDSYPSRWCKKDK